MDYPVDAKDYCRSLEGSPAVLHLLVNVVARARSTAAKKLLPIVCVDCEIRSAELVSWCFEPRVVIENEKHGIHVLKFLLAIIWGP